VWIFALNPLTLQNLLLPDIDNTFLTTLLLAMVWLWYRTQSFPTWRRVLLLTLSFTACLWFKLTTPPMLIVIMAMVSLLRRQVRRCLEMISVGVAAAVLFFCTAGIYSQLTGFSSQVYMGFVNKAAGGGLMPAISQLAITAPQSLGVFLLWLTPPQVLLWGVSLIAFARRVIHRQWREDDLLHSYAIVVTVAYMILMVPAWGYPVYHAPVVPIIAIVIAALLAPVFQRLQPPIRWALMASLLVGTALQIFLVKDPFYAVYSATFETTTADLGLRLVKGLEAAVGFLWLMPVGALVGVIIAERFKLSKSDTLTGTLAAVAGSVMIATTLVQASANYSTRYRYTTSFDDLHRAANLIKSRVGANAHILATKSIWHYAEAARVDYGGLRRYSYDFSCSTCVPDFLQVIQGADVQSVAWTTKDQQRTAAFNDPQVLAVLQECYVRETRGIFIIYLRNHDTACQ
jgi:hypothetical protein